jgi:dCTP diphosphatase
LHLKHTTALAPTLQESIPILTRAIREFATERTWSKYHLPRSLVLALLGELGELAELVQWNKDELQEISSATLDKLGQEIADVSIYLIRLSDICGVQFEKEA